MSAWPGIAIICIVPCMVCIMACIMCCLPLLVIWTINTLLQIHTPYDACTWMAGMLVLLCFNMKR